LVATTTASEGRVSVFTTVTVVLCNTGTQEGITSLVSSGSVDESCTTGTSEEVPTNIAASSVDSCTSVKATPIIKSYTNGRLEELLPPFKHSSIKICTTGTFGVRVPSCTAAVVEMGASSAAFISNFCGGADFGG
jgi:hypothetical protein